ncbi:MAG: hypothetical protein QOG06_762 [Gaiellaceae bacterium]|jgi:hypothetical protein|nr:hypothetical protein [Gaiellaceae bacterium]
MRESHIEVPYAKVSALPTDTELRDYFSCQRDPDSGDAYHIRGWCPLCLGPIDRDLKSRPEDYVRGGFLRRRRLKENIVRSLEFVCGCGNYHRYPGAGQVAAEPG